MKPFLSIIIPTYNASRFIGRAIDSCLSQDYTNFEIVTIDDGSTDNSLSILRDYAVKDSRVRVFTGANAGVVIARETAVSNSRGEFLLFMDADDTLPDRCLIKMVNVITPDTDMVIGDINQEELDGSASIIHYGNIGETTGKQHFDWVVRNRIGFLWGKLIRKSLMSNISVMPYGVKFCEDYIQMLQLSYSSRKVLHINEVTYNYIQQPQSACNRALTSEEYAQRFANLCQKLLELVGSGMYDVQSALQLKVLFLYYCRLYLCVSGKWGNNKELHNHFNSFMRDNAVVAYYKATDNRRFQMSLLISKLYPVIAFIYRRQLKKNGRIR